MLAKVEKLNITVLFGGEGREHSVSLLGKDNLLKYIDRDRFNVNAVKIEQNGSFTLDGKPAYPCYIGGRSGFLSGGEILPCDCVFPLLHGDFGEDGKIQGLLECTHIPYVGCDVDSGSLCGNKFLVKVLANTLSIPTVDCILKSRNESIDSARVRAENAFSYPMFVKPNQGGSSIGASAVFCEDEFESAINNSESAYPCDVIIEKYVGDKREIECGVLISGGEVKVFEPSEILTRKTYGYTEKYKEKTDTAVIAKLKDGEKELIKKYTRELVGLLGVRDLARVDFFLSGGEIFLNEINTMPGMTDGSLYPKMVESGGISFRDALTSLILGAYDRRS